jgi:hypothetical protein
MKRYKGMVVFRYYQFMDVEAESVEEAEQAMYSEFNMNRANGESEIHDLQEVTDGE